MMDQNTNNKCFHALAIELAEATGFDLQTSELVINTYIDQTQGIIEDLNNSIEQLMNEKANEALIAHIARQAHKLKGSSGNVRELKMMAMAEQTELACKSSKIEALFPIIKQMRVHFKCYLEN
ncbi:MAG: hypothetical protein BGO41_00030 [Clostridiales bacterium 38-18]|nr:MAG: hypothetical protein BGO41_00030 [Clostridiales bacterium 38-18]